MQCSRYNYRKQFGNLPELLKQIEELLCSGNYILGSEVAHFEQAFAAYCGTSFARGVNSGTDALLIALKCLGIGPGDEVITHANTFHATVAAIELVGARPVLVDACEHDYLMNISQVRNAVTERTRAIVPVHLYGKPTPMRGLMSLADKAGVLIVEDAAQAHGARLDGARVGSFGAAGCFSFHPSKNLAAAGDGGAIVMNDRKLADKVEVYRALGQVGQNNHVIVGLNSKLDAIQACILRSKLGFLDKWNADRNRVAAMYRERSSGLPISFQAHTKEEQHVYHLFQVRTKHRDALLEHLQSQGVDAVVRYPFPIHLQPAFSKFGWSRGEFPIAEMLAKELLCLPIRPDMNEEEVDFVTARVRQFYENFSVTASGPHAFYGLGRTV